MGSVAAAAAGLALWRHRDLPATQMLAPHGTEASEYVGDLRCAACHEGIHARQSHSRMARAMAMGGEVAPGEGLRPGEVVDVVNGLKYEVTHESGVWTLRVVRGGEEAAAPIHYLLGSGDRAMTPVCDLDARQYRELRVSYYGDTKSWDFTTGQEVAHLNDLTEALGRRIDKRSRLGCLTCHSTLLMQNGGAIDSAQSRFGVHCERCHGPGRRHAEAAERGASLPTSNLSVVQATSLAHQLLEGAPCTNSRDRFLLAVAQARDDRLVRDLFMCGECHGRKTIYDKIDDEELAMFQTAALTASRCYRESREKLRCTDCHDPHRDIQEADDALYVAVCRQCHVRSQPNGASGASNELPAQRASVCPIDAEQGCIACHMPKKSPMYRTRFTHHRIGLHEGVDAEEALSEQEHLHR